MTEQCSLLLLAHEGQYAPHRSLIRVISTLGYQNSGSGQQHLGAVPSSYFVLTSSMLQLPTKASMRYTELDHCHADHDAVTAHGRATSWRRPFTTACGVIHAPTKTHLFLTVPACSCTCGTTSFLWQLHMETQISAIRF